MSPRRAPTSGRHPRILIVDDSSDTAETMRLWLQIRGYQAQAVTDSTQCMARLETFHPDVLLLDIGMPRESGHDIARKIRANPRYGALVILAVSGYGDAEHVRLSFECGCNQHLVKPVDLTTLEAIFVDELNQSRPALSDALRS